MWLSPLFYVVSKYFVEFFFNTSKIVFRDHIDRIVGNYRRHFVLGVEYELRIQGHDVYFTVLIIFKRQIISVFLDFYFIYGKGCGGFIGIDSSV